MHHNKMKTRFAYIAAFLALGLAFASDGFAQNAAKAASPAAQSQEAPFGNADVVKLTKLDLGDQVVIAKIKQAKVVSFDLGTDALIQLKHDGVSKEVIAAMLNTATPQSQAASAPASGVNLIDSSVPASVSLRSKAGNIELLGRHGETKFVNAWVTALQFQEYPVLSAKVRIQDSRPSILVPLQEDPKRSQAYLVKLESDQKSDTRSLKIGHGMIGNISGLFGKGPNLEAPDPDWIIAYDATEERPGMWSLAPKADLAAGEYGYYFHGVLYDFGVDK